MNDNKPSQPESGQQIQIKITDETLRGSYANMLQVAHTSEEFFLDFMNIMPPAGIVSARVIVSPGHIKRMIAAMQENLKHYEEQFGEVKAAAVPDHRIGFKTE